MRRLCGQYVVLSPNEVVENACVTFTDRVIGIEYDQEAEEGTVVTHGFASLHTHLGLYPARHTLTKAFALDDWVERYAWPWERFLRGEPRLSYEVSLLALRRLVLCGVTAVADMHFNEDEVARAVLRVGMRGDLSVAIMSRGVYTSYEEALSENVELVRKFRGSELLRFRLGPTTPRLLSPGEFRRVVEASRELGVGVHTHLAEVREDEEYLSRRYGMGLRDFVEFVGLREVNSIVAHGVWLDTSAAERLAHPNVTLAHCPYSNTLLRSGAAPIRRYLELGMRVGLGVDVSPTYNILDEIKLAASMHLGRGDLSIGELFGLATSAGYRALGLGSGRIEPGEVADLVLWSLGGPVPDPIAGILSSGRVVEVYVGGSKVVEEGRVPPISEDYVKELERAVFKYYRQSLNP